VQNFAPLLLPALCARDGSDRMSPRRGLCSCRQYTTAVLREMVVGFWSLVVGNASPFLMDLGRSAKNSKDEKRVMTPGPSFVGYRTESASRNESQRSKTRDV
jgi:hypothetical protein